MYRLNCLPPFFFSLSTQGLSSGSFFLLEYPLFLLRASSLNWRPYSLPSPVSGWSDSFRPTCCLSRVGWGGGEGERDGGEGGE